MTVIITSEHQRAKRARAGTSSEIASIIADRIAHTLVLAQMKGAHAAWANGLRARWEEPSGGLAPPRTSPETRGGQLLCVSARRCTGDAG